LLLRLLFLLGYNNTH